MDLYSIAAGGIETTYAAQGTGHPVVLVHGWGATSRFWRFLWPDLASGYRAIAPDLPGWGKSGKPDAPYTIEWYAGWLDAFLDTLGVQAAAVVGHSMGGSIAIELAASRPQRVSHLVLACPLVTGAGLNRETRFLSAPGMRHFTYPFVKAPWVLRFITRHFQYGRRPEEKDIQAIAAGNFASLSRPITSMKRAALAARLESIRCPTLVVGADRDLVISPDQAALAARIPGARLEMMRDCGHLSLLEAPGEFNGHVVRFLREHGLNRVGARPPQW